MFFIILMPCSFPHSRLFLRVVHDIGAMWGFPSTRRTQPPGTLSDPSLIAQKIVTRFMGTGKEKEQNRLGSLT